MVSVDKDRCRTLDFQEHLSVQPRLKQDMIGATESTRIIGALAQHNGISIDTSEADYGLIIALRPANAIPGLATWANSIRTSFVVSFSARVDQVVPKSLVNITPSRIRGSAAEGQWRSCDPATTR